MRNLKLFSAMGLGLTVLALFSMSGWKEKIPADFPNILWMTSEDNSPYFGCYGDSFATTPNFDKLASEGFLYTHAYANAPVCAPARNTIITGVYANSNGNQHMRSNYKKSEKVREGVVNMLKEQKKLSRNQYDVRAGKWLLEKWGMDTSKYNIHFDW